MKRPYTSIITIPEIIGVDSKDRSLRLTTILKINRLVTKVDSRFKGIKIDNISHIKIKTFTGVPVKVSNKIHRLIIKDFRRDKR